MPHNYALIRWDLPHIDLCIVEGFNIETGIFHSAEEIMNLAEWWFLAPRLAMD
jgi:hypothetical protein